MPLHHQATPVQNFVEVGTNIPDLYDMKTDHQYLDTLNDNIGQWSSNHKLMNDNVQEEKIKEITGIAFDQCICKWKYEDIFQHKDLSRRHLNSE